MAAYSVCIVCGKIDFDDIEGCENGRVITPAVGDWVCSKMELEKRQPTEAEIKYQQARKKPAPPSR